MSETGYKTVYKGGTGEIEEKKSRFIASIEPVTSEEEAVAFFNKKKKEYWDARHNCTAFTIGEKHENTRCSDDGEPGQTAGRPMLEVLLGEGIRDICVVVTRYFGGTLLGTGGLVRAYSGAVKEGLSHSEFVEKRRGVRLRVVTDYNGIGKLQYTAAQMGLTILDTVYTDLVTAWLLLPADALGPFTAQMTEKTGGRAVIEAEGEVYYGISDGEIILF